MQSVRLLFGAACLVLAATPLPADSLLGPAPLPPIGTALGITDVLLNPRAVTFAGGWALALEGAQPEWYTADLSRTVLAADGAPVAAPNDAPLPSVVGIRPGAWMMEPHGCTMNFVFTRNGGYLIGTAGHCVDEVGQHVVILTLTPDSNEPVLLDIGTVVALRNEGIGADYALVAIRPELYPWVSPTMALVGGPCGSYAGSGPVTVAHYGHGLAIGTGGTPRAGVALRWEADSYGWDSPAISGDSGSPVVVLPDLEAAGNLTHLVVDAQWLPSFVAGTRIGVILQALDGLELAASPLCGGAPLKDQTFVRGDSNGDGTLDISDPINTLLLLYSTSRPIVCPDAADADDSGNLEITDAIVLFSYLFQRGPSPSSPFPDWGSDPTPDGLAACR